MQVVQRQQNSFGGHFLGPAVAGRAQAAAPHRHRHTARAHLLAAVRAGSYSEGVMRGLVPAPEVLVEPAVQQGVAAGGGHGEAVAAGEADVVPAVTAGLRH